MNLFLKNKQFIKKRSEKVYNSVFKEEPLFNVGLTRVEGSTNYLMEYNGAKCFLHSAYDINDELSMMFANTDKDVEAIMLFGFGCGHAVNYILNNFKKVKHFVIIEPSVQMFEEMMKEVDIEKLLTSLGRVSIIVNQGTLEVAKTVYGVLVGNNINKISFVYSVPYCTLFNEFYYEVNTVLIKALRSVRGTIDSSDYHKYIWLINPLINLKFDSFEVSNITELFRNRPVVIVSAGPSLKKNIHLLNELKKKAIVIAVGTTIKVLENNGFTPHFRFAVDSIPAEKAVVVDNIDTSSAPLIYSNVLYYEILPEYKAKKIHAMMGYDSISRYIYKKAKIPFLLVSSGCSVANSALNLACEAGCSSVIFLGQDMCYIDEQLYAEGSEIEEDKLNFSHPDRIPMKDIHGNDVYTLNSFINIKYNFEDAIKRYPEVSFINATEGGLGIEGTVIMPLKQVMDEVLTDELNIDIDQELTRLTNKEVEEMHTHKIAGVMENLDLEIEKAAQLNSKRLDYVKELIGDLDTELSTQEIKKKMDILRKIEKRLSKIGFYNEVVLEALDIHLASLRRHFRYTGGGELKEAESELKVALNFSGEVWSYLETAKLAIKQYKVGLENKQGGEMVESTSGNL